MIVLFTDFGPGGPYLGQVEAVLQQQAPGVPVIKLFSDLPPFNIKAAAYLLPAYSSRFPPGSVFLCVVDPGVGGERPGVLVKADTHWFVGPNEGLFALQARRAKLLECWQLPQPDDASASFHGRDVFAPVAARLMRDGKVTGEPAPTGVLAKPEWPDDLAQVIYIDRYGNAISGLRATGVDGDTVLTVSGQRVKPARTFSAVAAGELFWYENSNGLVEIAMNSGRADVALGLEVGSVVGL